MSDFSSPFLYGPVPSRRFGVSLGVDLTPFKTCSLNCVYCQLGRTANPTLDRKEVVPTDRVISDLEQWLSQGRRADRITLSGSGEPTLHSRFGEVLDCIKKTSPLPAVLLTNGTLLHLPEVRDAANRADMVKLSLSAWDQPSFEWVNRPHPDLRFDRLLEGAAAFRKGFSGELWLEVFLIEGMNAALNEVKKIAARARMLSPDRIQLNTAVRPPSEDFVHAVGKERLAELSGLFSPPGEVIPDVSPAAVDGGTGSVKGVLNMLVRRPCTARQIALAFGLHLNEVTKHLGKLLDSGSIRVLRSQTETYYSG